METLVFLVATALVLQTGYASSIGKISWWQYY